ncbi:undecaprenyl-phosphate alpha-N-acetylglucosaminyl 1-phosphate transferase [Geothermobacter hydrogeniphilus]|uniref:Undecaprenyl-phosphate alpha-N-acetylglucosaminyl 1-phosphate transferase n=1 Tax=Geothermobacter hydrogeniphilus TaxID=1969733 RepID=A0A2K2HAE4_9BACT|nr:MraY family glycosyltransferase [Geothermobacter hydrogeniphilus]PNU20288.1 undecaprenyl-phosphate alpha-N-acetylglucosaminyl 1-phosphate transferase [Geothermobacter hydrogeniphilus]
MLFSFFIAVIASTLLTPCLIRWAHSRGILDQPGGRKKHSTGVPRLGGIAIFLGASLGILCVGTLSREMVAILAGGFLIWLTGVIDDGMEIRPAVKLMGQILGVSVAVFWGGIHIANLGNLFGGGDVLLSADCGRVFTVFAIVGVINAVNMLDGLDALAAGFGLIALFAFLVLGIGCGNETVVIYCLAVGGGVVGFIRYNIHPAKIFMGDSGSLFLGYSLGIIAVVLSQGCGGKPIQPILPLIILGVPIIDTLVVMFRRIAKGKNPLSPDRTHLHYIFQDFGIPHPLTVVVICLIAFFWCGVALLCATLLSPFPQHVLFFCFLSVCIVSYLCIGWVRSKSTLLWDRMQG